MDFIFLINSMLLGVGLAMDAFSVSCANGLREPRMSPGRMSVIAGVYAWFQFMMPMIGWICVRTVAQTFTEFQKFIPWIALILLLWIGGKMLIEGLQGLRASREAPGGGKCQAAEEGACSSTAGGKCQAGEEGACASTAGGKCQAAEEGAFSGKDDESGTTQASSGRLMVATLVLQGIATSIDALSVGFTIAEYDIVKALAACLIIAVVTFVICIGGLMIGRKVGSRLAGKADIAGGVILIAIGIEIFLS